MLHTVDSKQLDEEKYIDENRLPVTQKAILFLNFLHHGYSAESSTPKGFSALL